MLPNVSYRSNSYMSFGIQHYNSLTRATKIQLMMQCFTGRPIRLNYTQL